VTAGPTREAIDPSRFLSNPSTGKMGYALAAEAAARGAEVTLISGPTSLAPPPGVGLVRVTTADEMYRAALNQAPGVDLVLKAAAVADYRPEESSPGKIKKEALRRRARAAPGDGAGIALRLVPTQDILEEVGRRKKPGQVLVGFAAETGNLKANARRKLRRKNLDLIVANRIGVAGEGFEADTNRAIAIHSDGREVDLPRMSKTEMASAILDLAERLLERRLRKSPRRPPAAASAPRKGP
jgi:phosphopantothenoylcysteine decarboxylase/phosphopantothenate--cysteine ligase